MDERMGWILLLEECQSINEDNYSFIDYEICSEVRIPGVLNYKNLLLCHIYEERNDNGLYSYILRVRFPEKEFKFDEQKYSKDGYYFSGGIIGELLSIFSFYFRTRFYLRAMITGEITEQETRTRHEYKFDYHKCDVYSNIEMVQDGGRNWAHEHGLSSFLDDLLLIDQKYHLKLMISLHLYSESIKDIGSDCQLFFIKMVSSVESLLEFIPKDHDHLDKKLSQLVTNGHFSGDEGEQIYSWLNNRSIRQRFCSFFTLYSSGFFKGGKRNAPHCHIRRGDLSNYIKRIYDARSKYLHSGVPMYLSTDLRQKDAMLWDLDPTCGKMSDRRNISSSTKLPRVRWFEGISHHCIQGFIKSLLVH